MKYFNCTATIVAEPLAIKGISTCPDQGVVSDGSAGPRYGLLFKEHMSGVYYDQKEDRLYYVYQVFTNLIEIYSENEIIYCKFQDIADMIFIGDL